MKNFTFSFKSLLLAAGLLMGSANAWGDEVKTTVYSNDFETSSDWSAKGKTDGWTCNPGTTTANTFNSKVIGVGAGTGDMGLVSPVMGINPEEISIVDVEMKFKMDACTSGKSSGIEFITSDVNINNGYVSSGTPFFSINASASGNGYWGTISVGGTNYVTQLNTTGTYENNNLNRNTTGIVVLNVRFNFTTKEATFTLTRGGSVLVSSTTVAFANEDATTLDRIFIHAGKTYGGVTIDDVVVSSVETSITYADYTVHFVDNNSATVKDDAVRSGEVGSTVNANSADMTTFYSGGNKYVYASDGGGVEVTNDGSAEFTVTYTKYGQFTYNVYAVNSSDVKLQEEPIATATVYEDETATLTWSKYIKIGGTWYSTAETTFRTTETEAGSRNVVYSASDVADFFEMENLTRSGGAYLTETDASYSNFNRLRLSKGSTYYTPALTAGVYSISIPWVNSNNSESEVYVYTRTSGGDLSDKLLTFTAPKGSGTFTGVITVPDGYSIAFNGNEDGSSNNNARMDYMTLTQISSVSATISAAGWATLYTPYALDFSEIDGLTAYTATEADGVVTLTAVDDVPANTGVVLKGTADTYKIPVIASSETDKGGLQGSATVSTNADAAPDGKAYYILTKSGEEAEFQAASGTIAAGKAYLVADWASGGTAKSLRVVVDGETTEVTAPEVAETEEEEVLFNMAGIQVDKNFKGFVINQKGVKRFNK